MFERYTEKARRTIFFARYEASTFGSPFIETEHLLLGLLREDKALSSRFPGLLDAADSIRKQIEAHTTVREHIPTSVDLPFSHEGKRVLAYGAEEAERLGHRHIGTEHLLLGLMREEGSFAAQMLRERGLQLDQVREEMVRSSPANTDSFSNVKTARQYLKALEEGATGEALARFFDPEIQQIEFPNRLNPKGTQRGLSELLAAAEQGRKVMASQSYTIVRELVAGTRVVLEVVWEGTLAVPSQSLPSGATLRAHFAAFLDFRDGKIIAQRNYDCFYPFPGE